MFYWRKAFYKQGVWYQYGTKGGIWWKRQATTKKGLWSAKIMKVLDNR